jgi:uracil-DNA glycosylase
MAKKSLLESPILIPSSANLAELRLLAADCKACHLWKLGTQTVFGEGSAKAKMLFVGEQPGNEEDLTGRPFVGPAGKVLDRALDEAGIDRKQTYVTNAVKHFKWVMRGKRRIHNKPLALEINACRPWLKAEIDVIRPKVLVFLGATASQSLLGREFRVTQQRGKFIDSSLAPYVMATIHPSAILRASDDQTRKLEMKRFIQDLKTAASAL